MTKYANDKNQQKVIGNFQLSRSQIMFQKTWHYKTLVSSPACLELAKNKGTSWAFENADSYAPDAVAIYIQ